MFAKAMNRFYVQTNPPMTTHPRIPVLPDVVVTRHVGLIQAARACGLPETVPVIGHVSEPTQIAGKTVLGVLPLRLAAHAKAVIEPDLELLPEDRGRELSVEETLARLRGWSVFVVLGVSR